MYTPLSNEEMETLISSFTKDEPRFIVVDEAIETFTKEFVFGDNDYCVLFLKIQKMKKDIGHYY